VAEALDQTDDEKRWAQAESILRDAPTLDAEQAIRRRRRAAWVLVAALIVLGLAIGLFAALLLGRHHRAVHEVAAGQEITGLVVIVLGLAVELAGLVLQVRAGNWGARWRAPTSVLTRAQKRALLKQVRGRIPLDPRRLALARDLATRLTRQRGSLVIMIGVMVLNLGQVIQRPAVWHVVLTGALVVLFAVAFIVQGRLDRQARRFLEAHPE
jgi:MFS family permease